MPESPELMLLIMLLSAAFLAGLIDAIAGGGGLITIPALLGAGVSPHVALGTNKLSATFGAAMASYAYIRKGIFKPWLWQPAILATFIGAALGTVLAHITSSDLLNKILPLIILATAVYMLLPKRLSTPAEHAQFRPKKLSSSALGATLGGYDGFAGPGTGAFWTSLLMGCYKLDLVSASGVARFMNFISNIVSMVTFMLLGHVDYMLGLLMAVTLLAGSTIGAHAAIRFGARFIRPVFIVVVISASIYVAWEAWL